LIAASERLLIGRMRIALCCLLLGAVLASATFAAEKLAVRENESGSVIDRVWSGHPVGFALLVENGHIVVAYYDAERRMTVAARETGGSVWKRVVLPGVYNAARKRLSTVTGWDSHNSLVLAVDRDGYLHLSGNLHVDPLVYFRTERPWEIESFRRIDQMTGDRETRCTYPYFFKNQAGDLLFRYRDGSSGDASDLYNTYDSAQQTWRRLIPTPLFDGEGSRSAYSLAPLLGPDGRFHLLWMWRDTPDAATNQRLSYARSADLLHWEDSQGRPIPLPITFGKGDVVDPAAPGGGLINTTYQLSFDRSGKPVALYHRYDERGRSQIYAARPTAEGPWQIRVVTDWDFRWAFGGGGTLPVDVFLYSAKKDSEGFIVVPISGRAVRAGQLRIDPDALTLTAVLPPEPPRLPAEWRAPRSAYPGMEVRQSSAEDAVAIYTLRWETLPSNRDQPRDEIPPPSELRLFAQLKSTSSAARLAPSAQAHPK
jgi:hypothetical protein